MATYTYDLSTASGKVRALIPDRAVGRAGSPGNAVFSDEELAFYLATEGGSYRQAAALALETLASNRVLVLQVIRTNELETDASKMMTALMQRAQALRDQAIMDDANAGTSWGTIDWVFDPFGARERLWDQAERQAT